MGFRHRAAVIALALALVGGVFWALEARAGSLPYGDVKLGEGGYVRVSAIGLPPFGSSDGIGAKEVARQNALGIAQRRLLASILDLPTGSKGATVRERLSARPQARERLRELIARAKVSGQELADGSAEVTLEVPYAGPGGLAEFFALLGS